MMLLLRLVFIFAILLCLKVTWIEALSNNGDDGEIEVIADGPVHGGEGDGKLIRNKRFLFNLLLGRNYDDYRFCGYNRYGERMYTNGYHVECSGSCPEFDYGRCFNNY